MKWYWYLARDNEILLDCDSAASLSHAMLRLGRNIRQRFLGVRRVYVFRSTPGQEKFHVFVFLGKSMSANQRALWQLHLGSDRIRELYTLTRIERGLKSPNLLIAKMDYGIPRRTPDDTCECRGKHQGVGPCLRCPVMSRIHGKEAGMIYYALRNELRTRRKIQVPLGAVSLSRLKAL